MCPRSNGWWKPQCVNRTCQHGGVHLLKPALLEQCASSMSVKVKHWKANGSSRVKSCSYVTSTEAIDACLNTLNDMKVHIFTRNWQRAQFTHMKTNLPVNCSLVVLDFADTFSCKQQSNVSTNRYYKQVTLLPVVVYSYTSSNVKQRQSMFSYLMTQSMIRMLFGIFCKLYCQKRMQIFF